LGPPHDWLVVTAVAVPALEPDVVGELVVAEVLVPLVAVPDVVAVVLVPVVVVPLAVVPDVVPDVGPDADVPVAAVPELVEPVEPVEPDVVAVLVLAALAEVLAPEPDVVPEVVFCEEVVVDPELAVTRAIDATAAVVVAVRRESAGSLPDTSCRKITDQSARNSASAIATTRRRITDTRRSRARSRCATRRLASEGAAAGPADGRWRGLEASAGVIGTSLRSWRDAMTTRSRHALAAA
jgi:hypothetical protein